MSPAKRETREELTARLFASDLDRSRRKADEMFAVLMALQLIGAVGAALWISPYTWIGANAELHVHVRATIFLGTILAAAPLFLIMKRPGSRETRYVVAIAQTLFSALLIHVTGGRIETHFHVFGSLAFLAIYRDFGLMAVATGVVAADHLIRGLFWPESVFGVFNASEYRWLEHAGWVLFEVTFLVISMRQSLQETQRSAERAAEVEEARGELALAHEAQARRLNTFQQAMDEAAIVLVTDADSRIVDANENFCRVSGYSLEELLGENPRIINSGTHEPGHFKLILETIGRGEIWRSVICNRAKDNNLFWLDMTIVPVLDEDGKPEQYVAVSIDVTQLVRAEKDLQTAKEHAETANRAKSEFLANMSHEIRTPMTAILGFAELLNGGNEQTVSAAQQVEAARTIRRNGEHLLSIINDILDISKIEAGKLTIECIPTDPVQIMQHVLSLMHVKAAAKQLKLQAEFTTSIPHMVKSDPVRLRQILVNLVGNAIKFTEQGTVRIRVAHLPNEQQLRFEVIDSGIGIAADAIPHLFDAFSQADTSTTRRYGGTGLGLRISKRLAQELKGDIVVTSTLGHGSNFCVQVGTGSIADARMIPADEASAVVLDLAGMPNDDGAQRDIALDGMRVLLAEDGPDNQRLIAFCLRKAGADVKIVENGRLAVEALTVDGTLEGALLDPPPFDLLLTDMQMPEMDGYAASGLLRSKGSTLPIVALTAHAMSGDEEKCLAAGCTAYATKPIQREELLRTCRQVVLTPSQAS